MNETNGASNPPQPTPASESSCVDAPGVNGHASRIPTEQPAIQANPAEPNAPSPQPVEQVLDQTLDEQDLKIAINVTANGRTINVMNLALTKVFYDALES